MDEIFFIQMTPDAFNDWLEAWRAIGDDFVRPGNMVSNEFIDKNGNRKEVTIKFL